MAWMNRFDGFDEALLLETSHSSHASTSNRSTSSFRTNGMNQKTSSRQLSFKENRPTSRPAGEAICCISDISSERQNVSLVGLVISKEGPKAIMSKKGVERHLIGFTLRDEPMAYINVTCWGSQDFVTNLGHTFKLGDIAEVKGAQAQPKSNNPADEKFRPWTPSSFQLNVSEHHSTMMSYGGPDISHFINLLNIPTRANNDFYTLEDIQENGMNLQGEHINILALVKKVWPTREIQTKFGKSTSKVDVVLCDETSATFNLTLWDNFVSLVENWIPFETVIFAADVRMTYNDYRAAMTASTDSKTIFTMDPETNEANSLRQFGQTQRMFSPDGGENRALISEKDPDIGSITDILTVQEAKTSHAANMNELSTFFVLYAFISCFDLDGREIVKHVCSKCGATTTDLVCENPDCKVGEQPSDSSTHWEYNLRINLTDHTGNLENCFVSTQVTEQLLGYKPSDLKYLPTLTKTHMKWDYLFERVKAIMKIRGNVSDKRGKSFKQVLSLERVDSSELVDKAFNPS